MEECTRMCTSPVRRDLTLRNDSPSLVEIKLSSTESETFTERPRHQRASSNPEALQNFANNWCSDVSYADFLIALQPARCKGESSAETTVRHSKRPSHDFALRWFEPPTECGQPKPTVDSARTGTARKSLPIFGATPCTAYCVRCAQHVHTVIDFTEASVLSRRTLAMLGVLCCGMPAWLNKYREHKCPECNSTLAKLGGVPL